MMQTVPKAVIFDMDGFLLDSERRWNEAKEALVRESGGHWRDEAPTVIMGMSSIEWSAYLRDELRAPLDVDAINREEVRRMKEGYRRELPLLPGAREAVRALAARARLVREPRGHRPRARAGRSRRRLPGHALLGEGRAREALPPTCTWRLPICWAPSRQAASPSRTRATACARPRPRGCP